MERTVDEIMNETPQFESQYAINVWVENLTVTDLISQLSKYSLSIDGKIEELTDRLARCIAMKRGYEEVPWDLSDQHFNFTFEFSHRLQTVIGENARIPNKLQRTHESQTNVLRRSGDTTNSPAAVRNSPMQRQEPPLIDFEAELSVPSVRNSGKSMQQSSAQLPRDETRDSVNEIRQPIRENRNLINRDNFNNRVLNGNAPSFVPRVNFALSSTTRANTETHARTRFDQELNNLTYSFESGRLDQGERVPNIRERTYTHRDTIPTVTNEYRDEKTYAQINTNTTYTPHFSLAGLPTRDATSTQLQASKNRNSNETGTHTTPRNFSHIPDARDMYRSIFTTPWLSYPRKIIRD